MQRFYADPGASFAYFVRLVLIKACAKSLFGSIGFASEDRPRFTSAIARAQSIGITEGEWLVSIQARVGEIRPFEN